MPDSAPNRRPERSPQPAFRQRRPRASPPAAASLAAVAVFAAGVGLLAWSHHAAPARPVSSQPVAIERSLAEAPVPPTPAAEQTDLVPLAATDREEKRDTVLHFVPERAGIYGLQIDGLLLGMIAAQPEGLYLSVPFKRGGTSYVTVSLYSESAVDSSLPRGCSGELCTRVTVPGDRKVAEMRFKLSRFVPSQVWTFTVD